MTSLVSHDLDADAAALELVRDRLAGLGRHYTPVDVASAMRAEGLAVSDAAVLEAVESLRRHSVGAGPLEPLIREPGVTDVLVNGADQVFIDRGAGPNSPICDSQVRARYAALRNGLPPPSAAGSTMRRPSWMQGCPTAVAYTPFWARWPHRGRAFRSVCQRSAASQFKTASLLAR